MEADRLRGVRRGADADADAERALFEVGRESICTEAETAGGMRTHGGELGCPLHSCRGTTHGLTCVDLGLSLGPKSGLYTHTHTHNTSVPPPPLSFCHSY